MADEGTSTRRVERLGGGLRRVSTVVQVFAETTSDLLGAVPFTLTEQSCMTA